MSAGGAAPKGIAFLGCGHATSLHGRTLRRHFDHVPRYFASRDVEKARAFARRFQGSGYFGSYAAAIADERVDTVFVATPPVHHLELTLAALDAHRDVIVEKPAFPRSDDYRHAARAARSAGRRIFVAENYFYKPLLRHLRERIASGVLGRIRFVQINAQKHQVADGWRADPALAGGGALLEGGIHWINLMANLGLHLTGLRCTLPGSEPGHERSALVVAEYAEGAVGTLAFSWEMPSLLRGLRLSRIWGTNGSLIFESNGLFILRKTERPWLTVPDPRDLLGYRAMFADFLSALAQRREPALTLAAVHREAALLERAYSVEGSVSSHTHTMGEALPCLT